MSTNPYVTLLALKDYSPRVGSNPWRAKQSVKPCPLTH